MEPDTTTSKQVQYEFRVIVRVHEDAWPHEVRNALDDTLVNFCSSPVLKVVCVERISDY